MEVLLYPTGKEGTLIRARLKKEIEVHALLPDDPEEYPWAGHLGIRMAEKIIPVIEQSNTTLVYINTRGMSET